MEAAANPAAKDHLCGVNFRYFQQKHQCLSDWDRAQIKLLSNWLTKVAQRTVAQIQSTTDTCHAHLGKKKPKLPSGVSPDVRLYNLDVTAGARVHGFFTSDTFYLVWLDRSHELFD